MAKNINLGLGCHLLRQTNRWYSLPPWNDDNFSARLVPFAEGTRLGWISMAYQPTQAGLIRLRQTESCTSALTFLVQQFVAKAQTHLLPARSLQPVWCSHRVNRQHQPAPSICIMFRRQFDMHLSGPCSRSRMAAWCAAGGLALGCSLGPPA